MGGIYRQVIGGRTASVWHCPPGQSSALMGRLSFRPTQDRFLYIFLDESGNLDVSQDGSRFFQITGVVQERPFEAYKDSAIFATI